MSLAHLEILEYDLVNRCALCGKAYKKKVSGKLYLKIISGRAPDPQCPRKLCRAAVIALDVERRAKNMAQIIAQQHPPGHVGSPTARAIDWTASIVMQDHKMGDLRSDVRMGEAAAPCLPPNQQHRADTFFSARNSDKRAAQLSATALAGGYQHQASPLNDVVLGVTSKSTAPAINKLGADVTIMDGKRPV